MQTETTNRHECTRISGELTRFAENAPGSPFGGWFGYGTTQPIPFVSIRVHSWLKPVRFPLVAALPRQALTWFRGANSARRSPLWRPRPELNWDHTFRKRVLYPFELRGPKPARKLASRQRHGHKKMRVDNPLPRGSLTDPLSNEHDRNEAAHPYARGDSVYHDARYVPLYHGYRQDFAP